MSPSQLIYLTDRTSIETDSTCGMKRWWYKEEAGTGIVPVKEAAYFLQGRQTHDDLARVTQGEPLEAIVEDILGQAKPETQLDFEPLYRRLGWVCAFGLFEFPRLLSQFEIIMIETELVLDRDPLWVATTPDLVLRERSSGRVVVRDYKSVGSVTHGWVNYWPFAIQNHIQIAAVQEEIKEKVGYAQIMGLYKGYERGGRLHHPYVWAYSDGKDEWATSYDEARRKGLTPRGVWEYAQGILQWTARLGEQVAREVFPFSAPIFLDERLLSDLITARRFREEQVRSVREIAQLDRVVRVQHFPPNFSECRPVVGAPCPYLSACHNATINTNPLASGEFVRRTPHHELEVISKED